MEEASLSVRLVIFIMFYPCASLNGCSCECSPIQGYFQSKELCLVFFYDFAEMAPSGMPSEERGIIYSIDLCNKRMQRERHVPNCTSTMITHISERTDDGEKESPAEANMVMLTYLSEVGFSRPPPFPKHLFEVPPVMPISYFFR